jgi:hypothetical protein
MWLLFRALIKEEIHRLYRRVLRRPEPPPPYSQFNSTRRPPPPSGDGTSSPV